MMIGLRANYVVSRAIQNQPVPFGIMNRHVFNDVAGMSILLEVFASVLISAVSAPDRHGTGGTFDFHIANRDSVTGGAAHTGVVGVFVSATDVLLEYLPPEYRAGEWCKSACLPTTFSSEAEVSLRWSWDQHIPSPCQSPKEPVSNL